MTVIFNENNIAYYNGYMIEKTEKNSITSYVIYWDLNTGKKFRCRKLEYILELADEKVNKD